VRSGKDNGYRRGAWPTVGSGIGCRQSERSHRPSFSNVLVQQCFQIRENFAVAYKKMISWCAIASWTCSAHNDFERELRVCGVHRL